MASSRLLGSTARTSRTVLVLGDVLALIAFAVVGVRNHDLGGGLLLNLVRISAPFLIGWFIAALAVGAYRVARDGGRGAFMLRSTLAWFLGVVVLGLLLRNTVFGEDFSQVFAIVTAVSTGLFLLGWRAIYALFSMR